MTFTSFKVPSDSMIPALLPGDYILVNKWVMGGRVFDIWDAVKRKATRIWKSIRQRSGDLRRGRIWKEIK